MAVSTQRGTSAEANAIANMLTELIESSDVRSLLSTATAAKGQLESDADFHAAPEAAAEGLHSVLIKSRALRISTTQLCRDLQWVHFS